MASNEAGQVGQILGNVFRLLKILTLNTWRRLLMLGHYTINCFHQQRLRRAWRVLGRRVHQALESGEVNPMLAGEVKDSLTKAQAIQAAKDKHYRAIVALREKIRASRAEGAPPPMEAEPVPPPKKAEAAPPPPEAEPAPAVEPGPIIVGEPQPSPAPEPEAEAAKESEPEKPQG